MPFQFYSMNPDKNIESLTSQTFGKEEKSYDEIVAIMQPGVSDMHGSHSGFLAKGEDLIEVLKKDTKKVAELKTTHTELGLLLWKAIVNDSSQNILFDDEYYEPYSKQHEFVGLNSSIIEITCTIAQTNGFQLSPFYDIFKSALDITLTRANGSVLQLSGLALPLISKWGFYEGNVEYRLAPEKIYSFFS